jgi:hypothetical protein
MDEPRPQAHQFTPEIQMNKFHRIGACAIFLAVAPVAWAAGSSSLAEAQKQYKQERAYCTSGQSQQDRATCLKEAENAYSEARRGALNNSGAGRNLAQNATQRCNAQPAADREACVQRITGTGSSEGSVKGGGIIRQTETVVK